MEELQARLSAVQPYLSSITSIAGFFNFSGPWLARIVSTCRENLIEHPDLASVTMLLVIFYISFLMLVRAWRFTIGKLSASTSNIRIIQVCFQELSLDLCNCTGHQSLERNRQER